MKIFFIGVCGTATGNVAILVKRLGHEVCGSDAGMYEPMKSALARANVRTVEGWEPKVLEDFNPDLVVVGNVVSRMNPQLEFVLNSQKYPYTSLPQLIGEHLIGRRPSLVVSGTHGKTTTTTVSAYLLAQNGANPGWLIGGIPADLPEGGSNLGGENSPFVIEGDEYDTAFFDKRSKFLHYRPKVLAINNIEFDHADIFRDIIDVKRTFTHVRRIVPGIGAIVENADDENIKSLEPTPWVRRISVGFDPCADVVISDFVQSGDSSSFKIKSGGIEKRVEWGMQGVFNARNAAMAATGVSLILGRSPLDVDISSLAAFRGVRRRQEVIYSNDGDIVVEDFGHHPTAIALTIESLRQKYAGAKIIACFEPRSNTARRSVLEDAFFRSLDHADLCYIGAASSRNLTDENRIHTEHFVRRNPAKFQAFASNEALLAKLEADMPDIRKSARERVFVFFSNGSFSNIHNRLFRE